MNKVIGRIFIFLCIGLGLVACASHSDSDTHILAAPDRLLPRDSMVDLVTETYITEGEIFYSPQDSDKQKVCFQLYANLFDKYHLTKEEFIDNCEYYLSDPDDYEDFMAEVTSKIEELRHAEQQQ
ncbi:MAG: DUF4296 domain-containing protein [Bacteroidales bacterium]|nr:DUF4296 domain-containing protein [Bacteroidales bacterium]